MEVSGQLHGPAALPPGNEPPSPGTRYIGGWVNPRAPVWMLWRRDKSIVVLPVFVVLYYIYIDSEESTNIGRKGRQKEE
jgi:hypothetical protein